MPSLFSRLRPGPGRCPRWLWGRRPRRRLLPPPPLEGLPGPAFIVLANFFLLVAEFYRIPKAQPAGPSPRFRAKLRLSHRIESTQLRVATGHTMERTPTLETNCYSRMKNFTL